ncbi:choice-of-anchor M domain-containing protein [Corynebacterium lizhenjunii]|uniref:Choice-of-anchor M domain-containing protein n=1 Tax=Corynebacterium lizhenjunii TaxID=2709394 RepID=A0A7T0PAN4_9CORY|nr:choice-of-anchor M domain-containing protein [Corynebacterium lizhenjunii]QPK80068.1 choice-of-anchor M domain-containing protein [Corynebacterium lizhenjunii]
MVLRHSSAIRPSRMGIMPGALAGVLALMALLCPWAVPVAHAQVALSVGHVDAFYVTAPDGQLHLGLKEDVTGTGVEHEAHDAVLVVANAAWSTATVGVGGIGKEAYLLPQTQDHGLLWPGWDTQPAGRAGFEQVELVFGAVSGPGEVYVFETNGFGEVNALTHSGQLELREGERIVQPYPAHRHVNWAFSQPGTYTMEVTAQSGGTSSNTATYTWQVGESADAPAASTEHQQQALPAQPAPQPARAGAGADSAHSAGAATDASQDTEANVQAGQAQAAPESQCVPGIEPLLKDDAGEWVRADGAVFHLGSAAEVVLPQRIGPLEAGPAWMIGSTQRPDVPWLGANTQHPSMREHTAGPVTWQLVAASGPGDVVVYTQGGLGQVVGQEWFSFDGTPSGAVEVAENAHVHPNWVFSTPGDYALTIRQVATGHDGRALAGQATLHVHVGGVAPAGAYAAGHFDLGGAANPGGGDCGDQQGAMAAGQSADAGTAAPAAAAGTVAARAGIGGIGQVAASNERYTIAGLVLLGLGMAVLGGGIGAVAWRWRQ